MRTVAKGNTSALLVVSSMGGSFNSLGRKNTVVASSARAVVAGKRVRSSEPASCLQFLRMIPTTLPFLAGAFFVLSSEGNGRPSEASTEAGKVGSLTSTPSCMG